jgi:2-iminobutanoate/2-iminopropanoate deaminase
VQTVSLVLQAGRVIVDAEDQGSGHIKESASITDLGAKKIDTLPRLSIRCLLASPLFSKGTRMANCEVSADELLINLDRLTEGEQDELTKLGLLSVDGQIREYEHPAFAPDWGSTIRKRAMHAPGVLNEAFHYAKPSSFSRGLRLDIGDVTVLIISGTASVDEDGKTIHAGDFGAQCWRTYRNIASLLESEGATWHDVVRTTCYLRDIERDYEQFNSIRTSFFRWLRLNPLPASVGVQARLCRQDLLVEIEAVAVLSGSGGE